MVFYLTQEEVTKMLEMTETLRESLLLRILYWGWRPSEVVGDKENKIPGIQFEDIDFEAGEIKWIRKGKKEQTRITDRETLNMIKLYCDSHKIRKGPILKMHRSTAHRIIKRLAHNAQLTRWAHISCHKFRHTFAIHALNRYHKFMGRDQRFNIALVSKQLGHADIKTTIDYYMPYVTVDLKEAAFGIT